ncbi:MAG: substrate-binding domain-containing protein [Chloroflexi bacterium]|nr:substrate-binding domain-containing protein [Chloroflexota bacterium]
MIRFPRQWLVLVALLLCACAPEAFSAPSPTATLPSRAPTPSPAPSLPTATPTPVAPLYALIAKARGEYWDAAAQGAQAAARQLGLPAGSVVYYAPEKEDAAAQIVALEAFVARGVRGIAIAPSDPRGLELSINKARAAGVWVTTFDTDASNSHRIFFVTSLQQTVGHQAAEALLSLLNGRTGAIALGSTWLNADASARIAGLKAGLQNNAGLRVLDAQDDRHDLAVATQAARGALAAQKDLAGVFGVYAYNGVAWCRAARDASAEERVAVVAFELTGETVDCLKDGGIDALVSARPYEQGLQSVLALDALARRGLFAAAEELHVPVGSAPDAWVVDAGADVISLDGRVGQSLAEYAAHLSTLGVPHAWAP